MTEPSPHSKSRTASGREAASLFAGAADYYLRYRPRYPEELVRDLAARFELRAGRALLDLGCGPGVLTLPLAATGAEVIAVDPQAEMLAAGREAATDLGLDNISWLESTAEALAQNWQAPKVPLACATLGRSFHWMQRAEVLVFLDRILAPAAGVVLIGEQRPEAASWRQAARDHAAAWYGSENPVQHLNTRRQSGIEHHQVLEESAFSSIETVAYPVTQHWPLERIIGYVYSTSWGNPARLGAGIDAFEAGLRERLSALPGAPDFTENLEVVATIALRPGA